MELATKHNAIYTPSFKKDTDPFFAFQNTLPVGTPFFQPKLTVNSPNDIYEKEADAVAEKVMSTQQPAPAIPLFSETVTPVQKKCAECEEEEEHIQKKELDAGENSFEGDATANPDDITQVGDHSFIQRESWDVDESNCSATLNWDLGCLFMYNSETRETWSPARQTAFMNAAKPAVENSFNGSSFRLVPSNVNQAPGWFRENIGAPIGIMDPTIPCPCTGGFLPRVNLSVSDQGPAGSADWHSLVYANVSGGYRQSDASSSSEVFGELDERDVITRGDITQTPIVHEFGHSIGLSHPGEGIAGADEYQHSGTDVNGNPVNGAIDLMGEGMGLRPFYFEKWKDHLNENFEGCNFTISLPAPAPAPASSTGTTAAPVQRKPAVPDIQKQDDAPTEGTGFKPFPPGITGRWPGFGFNVDITNTQLDFGDPAKRQLSLGLNYPGEPYAAITAGNFAFKLGYDFAENNLIAGGRYGGLSYGLLAGFENPAFGVGLGYGHFPLFNYGMRSSFQFGNTPLPFANNYTSELGKTDAAIGNFQQGGSTIPERLFSVVGEAGNFASMTGDMFDVANKPKYDWGVGLNAGYDPQMQWYFMLGAQIYLGKQEQRKVTQVDRKSISTIDENKLQRKQTAGDGSMDDPGFENYVGNLNGSGSALPASSQQFFESRFESDFSGVKVHTDSAAAKSASSINALAYTTGNNIVFNNGQYAPGTESGDKLIAHELTHVVQQGHGLQKIACAVYTVGNSRVNIDYGNVVFHDNILEYDTEIESRYTGFTGQPATPIHSAVSVLSNNQKRWLLYAIDLLADNPLASLNKVQAIQRLIDYVPGAINHPLDGTPPGPGYFNYESEVLRVSGWFELALTSGLAVPSAEDQRLLNFAYNNAASGATSSAGSTCPVRSASEVLNEPTLRSDLPALMQTFLQGQVSALNGRGIQTQNIADITPIADIVQQQALRFFAPYIGNSSSRTFLQTWRLSSHLTSSTAPNAIPEDALLAYLSNRARGRAGDSGLFARVHYDSRCDADVVIFNDIVNQLFNDATGKTQLAAIMSWQSFTGHGDTSANTVINLQYFSNQNECVARWRSVNTLCHEIMHPYVHSNFYVMNRGRRIITEGFTEVLGDQLYTSIRGRALANAAFRAMFEGGLTAGVCSGVTIPEPTLDYGDDGHFASGIRGIVGDDRFRAAYFLGQTRLAGLQPKLKVNEPGDMYEQEADAMAEKVMRMPDPATEEAFLPTAGIGHVQRTCAVCDEEEKLQRKEQEEEQVQLGPANSIMRKCSACENEEQELHRKETGSALPAVSPSVEQTLQSPGKPLDVGARSFMEQKFGHDFSDVQIHNDSLAHQSSSDINALAYTHQNHIAFAAGQYQPASNAGKQLLAHELTHVVQQQKKVQTQGLIQTQRTGTLSPTEILNTDAHTTTAYRDAVQHWPGANSIWDVLTSVNAKINFLRFILSFDETNCVRYDATDTNAGETCSTTASAVTRFTNACQGYASQMYARYTSSGRLSATAEANLQSQANIVIGVVPVKFQIPIRIETVPGHAFNAVLVDANPADANSWAFFEPQNDRIFFATDPLLRSSTYAGSGIFSMSSLTDFTSTGQYVQTDDRNFLLNSSNVFTNAAITPSQRITLNNLFRDIFIADDLSSYPYYTTHHTPPQTYEELIASHSTNDINTLALAFNSSLSGRSFRRAPGGASEIMTRAIYLQLLNNPSGLAALIP